MPRHVASDYYDIQVSDTEGGNGNFSGTTLFVVMIVYLLLGALFIPLLHGELDFFNGIYFAFICLTAIEYGDLVPDKYVNTVAKFDED
ncbi:hypothetical protein KIN20_003683 [Parelaphostrongylus tenuis]|uniref:Potassium channel domain-containing protein n=1 Tax=Parelaphostrongylus tenuis TaxID=148309 RepID=A0AAD5MQA3_PARTN|nr:hypothetical protein KIN20_003683 [Parelaphostrongylus tenuis]